MGKVSCFKQELGGAVIWYYELTVNYDQIIIKYQHARQINLDIKTKIKRVDNVVRQ
jgi:hypothetical protein